MTVSEKKAYRKSKEYLDSISFKELVKDINAKWGHTYEDIREESVQ